MAKAETSPEPNLLADPGSGSEVLARIAELLGCSPDALLEDGPHSQEREAAELMRIWCTIERPEDRRRVLDYARAVAGG